MPFNPKATIRSISDSQSGASGWTEPKVITVSDNGYGIVPEAMDKVFVPFFTTKQGGSGIGLSVCRQIMNRHGGSISVISEEEKGTTFTLQFPQTRVL